MKIMKTKRIFWSEPNRSLAAPLHIASRGQRLSTLTGVDWIDEHRFVVNHQVGMRIAVFDLRSDQNPILTANVPHPSDAVAARKIRENTWEIVVSGCWDAISSTYYLVDDRDFTFFRLDTKKSSDSSFCHGVSFGKNEDLCFAFHAGKRPRIEIGNKSWILPAPWGPRDVVYAPTLDCYFAVAVSHSASITAYETVRTTLWELDLKSEKWKLLQEFNNLHSDSCRIYHNTIFFPDQLGDRVLAIGLIDKSFPIVIESEFFDFPHGIAVSANGILAVTNYGNSSITLIDIKSVIIGQNISH